MDYLADLSIQLSIFRFRNSVPQVAERSDSGVLSRVNARDVEGMRRRRTVSLVVVQRVVAQPQIARRVPPIARPLASQRRFVQHLRSKNPGRSHTKPDLMQKTGRFTAHPPHHPHQGGMTARTFVGHQRGINLAIDTGQNRVSVWLESDRRAAYGTSTSGNPSRTGTALNRSGSTPSFVRCSARSSANGCPRTLTPLDVGRACVASLNAEQPTADPVV